MEQKLDNYAQQLSGIQEKVQAQAEQRAQLQQRLTAETNARAEAEQQAKAEKAAREDAETKLAELMAAPPRTGTCGCCGRDDVNEDDLVAIDSGDLFCPDCLFALRRGRTS